VWIYVDIYVGGWHHQVDRHEEPVSSALQSKILDGRDTTGDGGLEDPEMAYVVV
jgi:hypothetical protein